MKTTALILITAVLMTSNAFAKSKYSGSGNSATAMLHMTATVGAPLIEVTDKAGNPANLVISIPSMSEAPPGLTEQETIDYLNARIVIPQELKDAGVGAEYVLGPKGASK